MDKRLPQHRYLFEIKKTPMSKTIYVNKTYIYEFLDYAGEGSFKAAVAQNTVGLSTISAKEIFITTDLVL